jgi:hypothetical protein
MIVDACKCHGSLAHLYALKVVSHFNGLSYNHVRGICAYLIYKVSVTGSAFEFSAISKFFLKATLTQLAQQFHSFAHQTFTEFLLFQVRILCLQVYGKEGSGIAK